MHFQPRLHNTQRKPKRDPDHQHDCKFGESVSAAARRCRDLLCPMACTPGAGAFQDEASRPKTVDTGTARFLPACIVRVGIIA